MLKICTITILSLIGVRAQNMTTILSLKGMPAQNAISILSLRGQNTITILG